MGTIIEFPSQDLSKKLNLKAELEKIDFKSEELKQCVIDNVIPVMEKYNKLPKASFTINFPRAGDSEDEKIFVENIQSEIKKYASDIQIGMLQELLRLYVSLCKCELRNNVN